MVRSESLQTFPDLTKENVKTNNKTFKVIAAIIKDLAYIVFNKHLMSKSLKRADELNLNKKFPTESIRVSNKYTLCYINFRYFLM